MENFKSAFNHLLVDTFNAVLKSEENWLRENSNIRDLSVTEAHVLDKVGDEGTRSMTEVACDLHIAVSSLTTSINRLVQKGYVERTRASSDRRLVLVRLTQKGVLAMQIHRQYHEKMVDATVAFLSEEEVKMLEQAIHKLKNFFEMNGAREQ